MKTTCGINKRNNRRIIFINRYFYPDHSATSQILGDLAFYLSSEGFSVGVITSRKSYGDHSKVFDKSEIINGVEVHRVWTTKFGGRSLFGRALDYMSFYISSFFYMLFHITSNDVIVSKTDPPLISIISAFIVKLKGAVLINWIQDLFPEVARALGVKAPDFAYSILTYLRNYSLKVASRNVVIGDMMSQRLQQQGVDENSIEVIHNWSINDDIKPLDPQCNPLREEWGLHNKFIIGYSGNVGRAHEFDTLINVAKLFLLDDSIVFVVLGGGVRRDEIKKKIDHLNLTNFIFKPYQDFNKLKYSLTLPDLHIISLRPELEGLIVPSKFYGIAASGRPVLYIGSTSGEIPCIISANGCGESVNIEDVESAVSFVKKLISDSRYKHEIGSSARNIYSKMYNKSISFGAWVMLLKSLTEE